MNKINFDIIQLGHPHLRRTSTTVSDLSSAHFQSFIDSLLQFVVDKKGMGIAAVQVDVDQRVFIMCSRPNSRYPDAPDMAPTIVINPKITWASKEKKKEWEGCLSLPGIRALVPRHHAIKVSYLTRTGETIDAEYTGFIARIFQHELDHLNGMVFLDRMETTDEIMMEQEWQKRFAKA